ncbi:Tigger transposable element-derived protein 4 [Araneus ventricosus]|uniref:Tigger transposable element-derived protein 4 n=1 Tax=Araneus ventricosus TaxID=182803 RepID=A0A4Y2PPD7_ARAVE|nr:Tigger transposable element-derived protein 4 [Araneus ventricosus]GBN52962.1 Tigger transposable element-derived protein 4 [Araneus ventricosus]
MDRVVAYLMSELFTATSRETTDALTSPRATSRSDDRKRREPRTKSHRGSEPLRFHANDSSRDLTPSGSFMHARRTYKSSLFITFKQYGLNENTRELKKRENAHLNQCLKKLRVQSGKFADVEKVLLQWFNQCRSVKIPISGPLLMEKAQEISKKLNVECDASFSSGWLHKFKLRLGITGKTVSGDVDCETVDDWIENQLPDLIKGYEQKDVFNADETGLFYNLLPSKTLAIKSDTCHGGKKSKVRLTVLLCANADGSEKLPPLIIGKSKKPRFFKNVKALPTKYLSNKKSWMAMSFFTDWLKGLDDKMRKQKRRIILFIDQCPAHPLDTNVLKNITVKFFPSYCTSKLRSLELGIIKSLKQRYRKLLVETAIASLDHGDSKNIKIEVLQAMNFIMMAWQNVFQKTIKKLLRPWGIFNSSGCQSY